MLAQVPSPTPSLMQWTGAEPTSGNSSLPVQGMDCDTTGYGHVGKEWMKQIRREEQERVAEGADWRRSAMPWTPLKRAVTNSRRRETECYASATVTRPSMAEVMPKALAEETSQPVAIPNMREDRPMSRACNHTGRAAFEHGLQRRTSKDGSSSVRGCSASGDAVIEPTTISNNERLRLDAAAMVVDPSRSWAPLHSGLGHDVPGSRQQSGKLHRSKHILCSEPT